MAYVTIEGYLCERCGYRWAARNGGNGLRSKVDPRVCPHCKSPYWNKARQRQRDPSKRATAWDDTNRQESAAA